MEQLAEPETSRIWPIHRVEDVDFRWPEKGVYLQPDLGLERFPAERWVRDSLDYLGLYYNHPYFEDDRVPAPHWEEKERAELYHDAFTVAVLPMAATEAGWKRIFGPTNAKRSSDGSLLFSGQELLLMNGCFWRDSRHRIDYVQKVESAEYRFRRDRKSEAAFRELLDWDES